MLRHGSHSFTCKLHHACLSFVSVHQTAPPLTEVADIRLQLTTHRPQRDERLSWPDWLTYSGWFTHISGHPSATGRAQDRAMCTVACSTKSPAIIVEALTTNWYPEYVSDHFEKLINSSLVHNISIPQIS